MIPKDLVRAKSFATANFDMLMKIKLGLVRASDKAAAQSVENALKAKAAAVRLFSSDASDKQKDKAISAAEKALVYSEALVYPFDKFIKL